MGHAHLSNCFLALGLSNHLKCLKKIWRDSNLSHELFKIINASTLSGLLPMGEGNNPLLMIVDSRIKNTQMCLR